MRLDWREEWPHWVLIGGMFAWAAATWSTAPERFPVHWNLAGEVDRYGGKVEGLLVLPIITVGLYLLLIFLPRIDPGRVNYPRFAGAYRAIRLGLTGFLTAIYAVTQLAAYGYAVDVTLVIMVLAGLLFVLIGAILGQVRPNWFVGIRTPWTLSSERSWTLTHRFGGRLFVAIGLALIVAGLIRTPWALILAGVIVFGGVCWMILYSYIIWRTDPNRVPPAGVPPQ
jgi:uncharacterized membrane protein